MKYWLFTAVLFGLIFVLNVAYLITSGDEPKKPLDLTTLSNEDLMSALGEPAAEFPYCPLPTKKPKVTVWQSLESTIWFDRNAVEDYVRIIQVCTIPIPPGPAQ